MKKTILLDVDGVLRDMVTTTIQKYKSFYDSTNTTTHDDIDKYDMCRKMPLITDFYDLFTRHGQYIFGEAKPYEGAIDFSKGLDSLGDVHIVTNQVQGTEQYTIDWLRQYNIPFKSLHFAKDKNIVKGDFLIDDFIHNLEGFSGVPICVARPWNQEYEGIRMGYDEILQYVDDYK